MTHSDEIEKLKRDVQELLNTAGILSQRIEQLERATKAAAPVVPSVSEVHRHDAPPPMPPTPAKPKPAPVQARAETETPQQTAYARVSAEAAAQRPDTPPAPSLPAKPKQSWEVTFFTYVFPRLGIGLIGLAIVFMLALGMQKWGPAGRIGIGYATAAALFIGGFLTERKKARLGRVLIAGGFSITYFVSFAAHYIPMSRVIESDGLTMALLLTVVVAWTALAQYRQSRISAAAVTVLAHFTIMVTLLSTKELTSFAAVSLVFLSFGSAFFLLKNRWYVITFIGLVASYLNHLLWMVRAEGTGSTTDFWLCMLLLTAHFSVFSLSELLGSIALREKVPTWFRTIFVSSNTAGYVLLGTFTIIQFESMREYQYVFRFALSGALLGLAIAYLKRRAEDPIYNAYFVKAVAMLTLGLAAKFGENALTASIAVETVVLVYSARRSGLWITRVLAVCLAGLTFLYAVIKLGPAIAYDDPLYAKRSFQCGLTLLAMYAAAILHQRTDWSLRQPLPKFIANGLENGELLLPDGSKIVGSTLVYVAVGTILGIMFQVPLIEHGDRMLSSAVLALLVTIAAIVGSASALGIGSITLFLTAIGIGTFEYALNDSSARIGASAVAACACIALTSEKQWFARFRGLAILQAPGLAYGLYPAVAWLAGLVLVNRLAPLNAATALALTSIVAAGASLILHRRALAISATALLVWGAFSWMTVSTNDTQWYSRAVMLAILLISFDRFFDWMRENIRPLRLDAALMPVLWLVGVVALNQLVPEPWLPLSGTLLSFALLAYAAVVRGPIAGLVSGFGALVFMANTIFIAYRPGGYETLPAVLAFLANAGFWFLSERGSALAFRDKKVVYNTAHAVLPFLTALMMLLMLERIPALAELFLTISWFLLAFTLFGLALSLRHKFYRFASLAVFVIAMGRMFRYDAWELEGFYRVGAFAAGGVFCLLAGFGYVFAMSRIVSEQPPPLDPMPTDNPNTQA